MKIMILVVSQKYLEMSTDRVLEWINYLGGSFMRINGDDICKQSGVKITINNLEEKVSIDEIENVLNVHKFKIAWYRRWRHKNYDDSSVYSNLNTFSTINIFNNLIANDITIKRFLLNSISVEKWLTDPKALQDANNKINVLKIARKHNLSIPSTIICSKKIDLISFMKEKNRIITKDITIPYNLHFDDGFYFDSLTNIFTEDSLKSTPDTFMPTLFQEYLEKEFEIRSFFLDGCFYSMAIFSQNDDRTQIDFRNYNWNDPNRTIPYKLPKEIETKLQLIFSELNLNTGSVDIIKDINGKFIFLEINPIGQFGMTSEPCNYNLEKKIAEYLIKNDN